MSRYCTLIVLRQNFTAGLLMTVPSPVTTLFEQTSFLAIAASVCSVRCYRFRVSFGRLVNKNREYANSIWGFNHSDGGSQLDNSILIFSVCTSLFVSIYLAVIFLNRKTFPIGVAHSDLRLATGAPSDNDRMVNRLYY
jgi:hypothetical protein